MENTYNTYKNSDDEFDAEETKDLETDAHLDVKEPFDPKKVEIATEQKSLDLLITRLEHDEIDLNPEFQRNADLWSLEIQSKLIESLMIKLPIPAFYFDASNEDKWQVIDGLQRLTAIKKFVLENNKLKKLEYLTEYNGRTFEDLPRIFQRRIKEASVTLYLIKPGTPAPVKYSLFYRINTGGLKLNAQEIRHALSQNINDGRASQFLKQLAEEETFQTCAHVSSKRMLDKELILRFVAFKSKSIEEYKEPMITYLNNIMEDIGNKDHTELEILKKSFLESMEFSYKIFGEAAFRKTTGKNKVINRALFETISVVFSELDHADKNKLMQNSKAFIDDFQELLKKQTFHEAISISTTFSENIKKRFKMFRELIDNYII